MYMPTQQVGDADSGSDTDVEEEEPLTGAKGELVTMTNEKSHSRFEAHDTSKTKIRSPCAAKLLEQPWCLSCHWLQAQL